jgi:hypothetical protein
MSEQLPDTLCSAASRLKAQSGLSRCEPHERRLIEARNVQPA